MMTYFQKITRYGVHGRIRRRAGTQIHNQFYDGGGSTKTVIQVEGKIWSKMFGEIRSEIQGEISIRFKI